MKPELARKLLTVAAVCALVGLTFMVWSLFVPSPLFLVAAMSVGQAIGTLSFLLYGTVVVIDLWKARVPSDEPPEAEKEQ